MFQLHDGGETSFFRSGRTHPDFRNLGLTPVMFKTLKAESKAIRPEIKRMIGCMGNNVDTSLTNRMGFTELFRKRRISLSYKSNDISPLNEQEKTLSLKVHELNSGDLEALFLNKELVGNMFPGGLLFNRSIGYRPMKSNIRHLINDFSSVFVTAKNPIQTREVKQEKRTLSDVMIGQIDLMTCSQSHWTLSGHVYTCEIYCSGDVTSLDAHLVYHVNRMKEVTPGDGILLVTIPDCVSDEDIVAVLRKYRIKDILPVPETHLVLFEMSYSDLLK